MTRTRRSSPLRQFLESEAAGGLVLMAAAACALAFANSPWAAVYEGGLHFDFGPFDAHAAINDGLMALFFLLVGLEIKREILTGELSTWPRRMLPGLAALGGMIVPALIYAAFNWQSPATLRGWAIPAATDIAFALGTLALLGKRVPVSLKVFLTALAILDDLGAVLIIALFYTADLHVPALIGTALVMGLLTLMNRRGVSALWPYLTLGALLWLLVLYSGVHATLAGVALALTIPIRGKGGVSPLERLEHVLHKPVTFFIVPLFGFANAGLSFAGLTPNALTDPPTLGVGIGLVAGKLIGVFATARAAVGLGYAEMPHGARWTQLFGVALLCGIGFTMSLFIALLAFNGSDALQSEVKLGILGGSAIAGVLGWLVLRFSR